MKKSTIEKSLKAVLLGCALCGLAACFYVFPEIGRKIITRYPEFQNWFLPWLLFLWAACVPCFCVLVYAWKIVASMKNMTVFTHRNSSRLRVISYFALFDTLFFFMGNLILWLFNRNHPGVVIMSLGISFVGFAIFIFCQGLSLFAEQAADLQEQSDLTI